MRRKCQRPSFKHPPHHAAATCNGLISDHPIGTGPTTQAKNLSIPQTTCTSVVENTREGGRKGREGGKGGREGSMGRGGGTQRTQPRSQPTNQSPAMCCFRLLSSISASLDSHSFRASFSMALLRSPAASPCLSILSFLGRRRRGTGAGEARPI